MTRDQDVKKDFKKAGISSDFTRIMISRNREQARSTNRFEYDQDLKKACVSSEWTGDQDLKKQMTSQLNHHI